MAVHVIQNPFNHHKDMAVLKDIPADVNYDRIEKINKTLDEYDNPKSFYPERSISDENARNQELFDTMKYEVNRLNSFTGKWPLRHIKPSDLAENGFFYLQSEAEVQCAFCNVVIDHWNVDDTPLKKHMMRNPKCLFLLTAAAGNVPFTKPKPVVKSVTKAIPDTLHIRNTSSNKPKYPQMSNIHHRLHSYRDWPLLMLSSRQLAECGLFYTGLRDFVTCFYCGGSLGDWELNDDPWVEHKRHYPTCGYLDLVETRIKPTQSFAPGNDVAGNWTSTSARPFADQSKSLQDEVIQKACESYPNSLVRTVAVQHFSKTGAHFTSLGEIIEAIEQYQTHGHSLSTHAKFPPKASQKSKPYDVTSNKAAESATNSKLICKICLDEDEEMNVVFEPCHHQVACNKCAQKVTSCPLCRRVITNRIKVFWG